MLSRNQFRQDDSYQRAKRDALLKPFYAEHSAEGRFVFLDKGQLADVLQREMAVDTILQGRGGHAFAIEEKIVRWKGRKYTAFTLETWTCTVPGRERKGWMYYGKCDILLYCFTQADGSLEAYAIPFPALKTWFFEQDRFERYPTTVTEQINRTECRVVPIADVLAGVPGCKLYYLSASTPASTPATKTPPFSGNMRGE